MNAGFVMQISVSRGRSSWRRCSHLRHCGHHPEEPVVRPVTSSS